MNTVRVPSSTLPFSPSFGKWTGFQSSILQTHWSFDELTLLELHPQLCQLSVISKARRKSWSALDLVIDKREPFLHKVNKCFSYQLGGMAEWIKRPGHILAQNSGSGVQIPPSTPLSVIRGWVIVGGSTLSPSFTNNAYRLRVRCVDVLKFRSLPLDLIADLDLH